MFCFAIAPYTVQLQLWGLRRRVGLVMVFMMCVCPLMDGQRGAPAASASPSISSQRTKPPTLLSLTLPSSSLHHTRLARKAHKEETQEPRVALFPSPSHGRRQRYVRLPPLLLLFPHRSSSIIIIIDRERQARLRMAEELRGALCAARRRVSAYATTVLDGRLWVACGWWLYVAWRGYTAALSLSLSYPTTQPHTPPPSPPTLQQR